MAFDACIQDFQSFPSIDVRELSDAEIDFVSGAVNGVQVAEGVGMVAAAVIAVASAPVSVPLVAAACVLSFCGGYIAGHGLASD